MSTSILVYVRLFSAAIYKRILHNIMVCCFISQDAFNKHVYIGKVCWPNTMKGQSTCTYLGYLVQSNTNVANPIRVKWTKVAKVSTAIVTVTDSYVDIFFVNFNNVSREH